MRQIYRILDANANRAREALRVIEDFARFALDDAAIAASAKHMRSRLAQATAALPPGELLASRDTPGDIGTKLTSATEASRPDAPAVADAACKRLTEALRTLEEYAKVAVAQASAPTELPGQFESLRYEAYTLTQRVGLRLAGAGRFEPVRLYVLLTTELCRVEPLAVAAAAIKGGADCIQLREKHMPDREVLNLARRLREVTLAADIMLIINDRPDIAAAVAADGIHLGQDDLPVAEARRMLRPGAIVGKSTHDVAQAHAAADEGADYIALGPIFPSPTKDVGQVVGVETLAQLAGEIKLPLVAVGGITAANVAAVVATGAKRVAVCSAVIANADPAAAAAAIKQQLPA